MTVSVREALARAAGMLRAAGIESARLDARVLLGHYLGMSPEGVLSASDLPDWCREGFDRLIGRRAAREPVAYITGAREFWSRSFAVGPGVLVPRPETETLVEAALEEFPDSRPLRVLDLGTGSGCLLVAFLMDRPLATGIGVDSSDAALAFARRNVSAHGLGNRARLVLACWTRPGQDRFDVIFSNPPYLSEAEFGSALPEIRDHEPKSALVAGRDGLDALRALGPVLAGVLAQSGLAFVEIGAGQHAEAAKIVMSCGLDVRKVTPDLSGVPRCLVIGWPGPGRRSGARRKNQLERKLRPASLPSDRGKHGTCRCRLESAFGDRGGGWRDRQRRSPCKAKDVLSFVQANRRADS